MSRPSPSDYMRQYHNIQVNAYSPKGTPMLETVHITRYQTRGYLERDRLIACIKKLLGIRGTPSLHSNYEWFAFAPGDPIKTTEPFYFQSIRRAFGFKGSPREIHDVLKLACRMGRIGTGKDILGMPCAANSMAMYARENFGLDCNGFVGNYFGLSPEVDQSNWADITAATEKKVIRNTGDGHYWNGWGVAAVKTLDYIPLTPRKSASEVRTGDVIVVLKDNSYWSHIAVVDHVTHVEAEQVNWRVVEYGSGTSEASFGTARDAHIKPFQTVKLVQGPRKKLGIGYQDGNKFKFVFAGPNSPFPPATIGRCGVSTI